MGSGLGRERRTAVGVGGRRAAVRIRDPGVELLRLVRFQDLFGRLQLELPVRRRVPVLGRFVIYWRLATCQIFAG